MRTYLVCKATNEAAIIDTAAHPDDVLQKVEETGVKPTMILLTHAHGDHANGLMEIERATGCPTYIHAREPLPRSTQQLTAPQSWGGGSGRSTSP